MRVSRSRLDPELVALTRRGSPDALGELYARHADRVMAVAYRLTGSAADAEDVTYDVFLGLPEALSRYEERGAFDAWLRQLSARTALSRMRARVHAREVPLGDDHHARDALAMSADAIGDRVAIAAAMARLPEALRVVFALKAIDGHSHAGVAELLGISEGASEVRLVRAMKLMRQFLGGEAR